MRRSILLIISLLAISNTLFATQAKEMGVTKEFVRAQNLVEQGKTQQAINAYQSIINIYPQVPEAYNNLAALYLAQKNIQQAKITLEQGLKAHEGYARLYESLTAINIALARDAYSKALQIDLEPSSVTIASLPLTTKQSSINVEDAANVRPVVDNSGIIIKPVPQKADNKTISEDKVIKRVLQAWLAAWSAQSVDIYLSFYHDKYEPAKGLSRAKWVESRRIRLKKPNWIKVNFSDFKVSKNTGKQAIVNFKQIYQSNSFRDVSLKQLVLLNTDNGWQILRERSL